MNIFKTKLLSFSGTANGNASTLRNNVAEFIGKKIRIHSIKGNFFANGQTVLNGNSATVTDVPTNYNVIPDRALIPKNNCSQFDYNLSSEIYLRINQNNVLFSGTQIFNPEILDLNNMFCDYNEPVNSIEWFITATINKGYGATPVNPYYSIEMLIEVID